MDTCLHCGQSIPLLMRIRGEFRYCCTDHRKAHQQAARREAAAAQAPPASAPSATVAEVAKPAQPPLPMGELIDTPATFLRIPGGAKHPPLVRASWRYRVAFSATSGVPESGWPMEGFRGTFRPEPANRTVRQEIRQELQELQRQAVLSRFSLVTSLMRLDRALTLETDELLAPRTPAAGSEPARPTAAVVARHRGIRGFPIPLVGQGDPGMAGYVALRMEWFLTGEQPARLPDSVDPFLTVLPPALPVTSFVRELDLLSAESCEQLREPEVQGGPIDTHLGACEALPAEVALIEPAPLAYTLDAPWSPRHYAGPADVRLEVAARLRDETGGGELRLDLRLKEIDTELDTVSIVSEALGSAPLEPWRPAQVYPSSGGPAKDLRERRHGTGIHVPQIVMRPLRPRVILTEIAGHGENEQRQAWESGVISISALRSAGGFRR